MKRLALLLLLLLPIGCSVPKADPGAPITSGTDVRIWQDPQRNVVCYLTPVSGYVHGYAISCVSL